VKTEWEKEMMKWTKTQLFTEFGVSGHGISKTEQIKTIKKNLDLHQVQ
jgi:hypothetical protein